MFYMAFYQLRLFISKISVLTHGGLSQVNSSVDKKMEAWFSFLFLHHYLNLFKKYR